jgi:hypothetical protein
VLLNRDLSATTAVDPLLLTGYLPRTSRLEVLHAPFRSDARPLGGGWRMRPPGLDRIHARHRRCVGGVDGHVCWRRREQGDVTLTPQQSGTKVTGTLKVIRTVAPGSTTTGQRDEEITGTVNGDVLRAWSTSGRVEVELTVAGSEMAGPGSAFGTPVRFVLRQKDHQESQ